jgi:inorganic pyrophosphatase
MHRELIKEIRDDLHISDMKARQIYLIINGKIKVDKYLKDAPGYLVNYSWHEKVLDACDKIIDGFGVESHFLSGKTQPEISWVNVGDPYSCTIVYDHNEMKFIVASYGDWLENPKRQEELHELALDNIREATPSWGADPKAIFNWMWRNDQEALDTCECCDTSHPSSESIEAACIAMGYKDDGNEEVEEIVEQDEEDKDELCY